MSRWEGASVKSAVKAKMCGGVAEGTACRLEEVMPIRAAREIK